MNKIDELIKHVKDADAIVVGAGSGMLRATGLAFGMKIVRYIWTI